MRSEGWGRVNPGGSLRSVHSPSIATGRSIDMVSQQRRLGLIRVYYTQRGGTKITKVMSIPRPSRTTLRGIHVDDATYTLKATLTWCDPSGPETMHHPALIAEHEDGERRHSNLGKKNVASSEHLLNEFNLNNTVQQIVWRDVNRGKVTLTVCFVLGPRGTDADSDCAVAWTLTNC